MHLGLGVVASSAVIDELLREARSSRSRDGPREYRGYRSLAFCLTGEDVAEAIWLSHDAQDLNPAGPAVLVPGTSGQILRTALRTIRLPAR